MFVCVLVCVCVTKGERREQTCPSPRVSFESVAVHTYSSCQTPVAAGREAFNNKYFPHKQLATPFFPYGIW